MSTQCSCCLCPGGQFEPSELLWWPNRKPPAQTSERREEEHPRPLPCAGNSGFQPWAVLSYSTHLAGTASHFCNRTLSSLLCSNWCSFTTREKEYQNFLETNDSKCQLLLQSRGVCFNSYGHITQTLFWRGCKSWNLRTGFTEEMSICLSELTITSLCFTLLKIHWFVLYRNRLDDKVHEYGCLKKIYSPDPCVYKNYHKVVMFLPDWQILLSHIIFPAESLMLLISALLTQLSDSVVGTANILCVFIFIPFLYFIFHYVVLTNS